MSPRRLAVCFAHPDDETYATFGSVALHAAEPGFRLSVLHATDGGAGEIAPGMEVRPEDLGSLRRLEDELGWAAVGHAPDRHQWLDLPDGRVREAPHAELVGRIAAFLDEERPDVVVTFGPDGVTGHPDHIAMSAATGEAFHAVRRLGGRGLSRLLHAAIPQSTFERHQALRRSIGLPAWDPTRLYHLRGTPDAQIGIEVRTRAVAAQVFEGLSAHRSQHHVLMPSQLSDDAFIRSLTRETHVVAWPPRPPGAARLRDLFEGLA